jgi:outer membrane protein TolC
MMRFGQYSIRGSVIRLLIAGVCLGGLLAGSGCTAAWYRKSADKEVYKIIDQTGDVVEGMPDEFTIDAKPSPIDFEPGTTVTLNLREALKLSAVTSRLYQDEKETLYERALTLSLARWRFAPIFTAVAEGEWIHEGDIVVETPIETTATDGGDGTEVDVEYEYSTTRLHRAEGQAVLGISKTLATGGNIGLSFITNMARITSTADPDKFIDGLLVATFNQPLLRGAGPRVALEPLTQAERDMIYSVREFVRFRREFMVDIAKSYLDILQGRDRLQNSRSNYNNLVILRERTQFMSLAGEMPEFEVGQALQDELRAYAALVRDIEQFANQVDSYKLELGVPMDINLVLDPSVMDRMAEDPVTPPPIDEEGAIAIALANRLDLKSQYNRVDDADRHLYVARNALLPQLDVSARYEIRNSEHNVPLKFEWWENDTGSVGASLELPLDRKDERNEYRRALIDYQFQTRTLEERVDRVKQEVRNSLRSLSQAEQSYRIQQNSLNLAKRRVENLALLQEAGEASTRDVLDAQADLLEAQNAVINALVDHYKARLDLHLAMETLDLEDGWFAFKLPKLTISDGSQDNQEGRGE